MHLGITGGIGSGKTTVCRIFRQLGVPVYDSDLRAKELIATRLKPEIMELFGRDLFPSGKLDRALLAQRAFTNKDETQKLNQLVHPAVGEDYKVWRAEQKAAYTLKEAALLIEAGSYKELDKLIVVLADEELRIQRVMERSNMSREEVQQRMSKQLRDEQRLPFADFIIHNSGEQSLIKQVLNIHLSILSGENR